MVSVNGGQNPAKIDFYDFIKVSLVFRCILY